MLTKKGEGDKESGERELPYNKRNLCLVTFGKWS